MKLQDSQTLTTFNAEPFTRNKTPAGACMGMPVTLPRSIADQKANQFIF